MSLYKDLAHVYKHMYQHLFDYNAEYNQLRKWIDQNGCLSILECGCGTGNLANKFIEDGYDYAGFDISPEMVAEALYANPEGHFYAENVVSMNLESNRDAIIMVGRTISYLLSDEEVVSALTNMYNACSANGIIIIDPIDASKMPFLSDKNDIIFEALPYKRYSRSEIITMKPYLWEWKGKYVERKNDGEIVLGHDEAVLRAFYHDELVAFFEKVGLKIVDLFAKKSYAWDDHYYVLKKV